MQQKAYQNRAIFGIFENSRIMQQNRAGGFRHKIFFLKKISAFIDKDLRQIFYKKF
jgi:hypothetical protein